MTSKDDEDGGDAFFDEFRRELEAYGLRPRHYAPRPGDEEAAARELARIVALPRSTHSLDRGFSSRASTGRPRRIVWPVMLTAAALVAVFFVVVRPGGGDYVAQAGTPPLLRIDGVEHGTLPASGSPAADVLHDLADKARHLPYADAQPVQQVVLDAWFAETGGEIGAPVETALRPVHRESYFLPDDTLRVLEQRGPPLDQDGRITSSATDLDPDRSDESFASPDPGSAYASGLPTEPAALRQALLADFDTSTVTSTPGGALLFRLTDISHTYVLPPDVLAATWEAMAQEPAISVLGVTRDRRDREALVLSAPAIDGVSQQLVFADPATGAVLGDETVLVNESDAYAFTPPAVTSFNMIVSSERVDAERLPQ